MVGLWFLFLVVATMVGTSILPVHGLANRKKSNNSSSGGGGGKKAAPRGFGVPPPPSLETLLATFPTRMPPPLLGSTTTAPLVVDCPCGSGQTYETCCGPLHTQSRACRTMVDVLRSRYSAFCWRNIGHILATTHPTNRDYREDKIAWAKELHKEGMFDSFDFVRLEIGKEEGGREDENEGFLEFQVTLRGRGSSSSSGDNGGGRGGGGGRQSAAAVAGLETVVKERSRFLRDAESGIWFYAGGDVTSEVAGLEDTPLNV